MLIGTNSRGPLDVETRSTHDHEFTPGDGFAPRRQPTVALGENAPHPRIDGTLERRQVARVVPHH